MKLNKQLKTLLLALLVTALVVSGTFALRESLWDVFIGTDETNTVEKPSDAPESESDKADTTEKVASEGVNEDGEYLSKDDVAEYIHKFGKLPKNFLTKNEAKALGWDSSKGNLWVVAPGCAIGGDKFRNYEGQLPQKSGRIYYECDVNYDGGYRDAERIVFSNDGLIFYTADHYETFTELYGE